MSRRVRDPGPYWLTRGRGPHLLTSELVAAEIRPGAAFTVGDQRVLFSTAPFTGGAGIHSYAASADGRRFIMTQEGEPLQESELVVAQGWLQQLKTGK